MLLAIKTFGFVRTTRAQFQHKGLDDINPSDVGWGADDQSTMPAIRNEPTTKGKRVVSPPPPSPPHSLTRLDQLAREGPRPVSNVRQGPQPQGRLDQAYADPRQGGRVRFLVLSSLSSTVLTPWAQEVHMSV